MQPDDFFFHSNLLMVAVDVDGIIRQINPAAEKLLARPAEAVVGRAFAQLLDPFSREKGLRMLAAALQQGEALDWELDVQLDSALPVLVGFSAFKVSAADGTAQGYACVGHDLTEKMDFAQSLAKANQELEGALLRLEKAHSDLKATQAQLVQSEKMRALGQMVAGVAHEINNPAAYVANNLLYLDEVLPKLQSLFEQYRRLNAYASPAEQSYLNELEQQADLANLWHDLPEVLRDNRLGMERITTIVRSLRNFAQMDGGVMRSADLNEGLRSTLNIVRPLFQDRVVIMTDFGDLPDVEGYAGELNQVFLNLLMNACQAIVQHGTVWVSTQSGVDGVQVIIRDSGCGMDEVTLARLGEPFFTTKDVGQGTGLGLAISFAIIEKHRGKITYESRPGQGTTVRVDIPARTG